MKLNTCIILLFMHLFGAAQKANIMVAKGNEFYKQNDLNQAQQAYEQAIATDKSNLTAPYNLGNTLFKQGKPIDAAKQYDWIIENTPNNKPLLAKTYYNKGITAIQQQQLTDAVAAFKQALRNNPDDADARENLQKALNELNKKLKKEQPKQQDKQQKQPPPKPNENKLTKQQLDKELDKLRQQEKQLQQQIQQQKTKQVSPEKDW